MADDYMTQLERINEKMRQLQNDPERLASNARWRNNFLGSIQAIKAGQERVVVASGGIESVARRMKATGLLSTICDAAGRVEDARRCASAPGSAVCMIAGAVKDALSCPVC